MVINTLSFFKHIQCKNTFPVSVQKLHTNRNPHLQNKLLNVNHQLPPPLPSLASCFQPSQMAVPCITKVCHINQGTTNKLAVPLTNTHTYARTLERSRTNSAKKLQCKKHLKRVRTNHDVIKQNRLLSCVVYVCKCMRMYVCTYVSVLERHSNDWRVRTRVQFAVSDRDITFGLSPKKVKHTLCREIAVSCPTQHLNILPP